MFKIIVICATIIHSCIATPTPNLNYHVSKNACMLCSAYYNGEIPSKNIDIWARAIKQIHLEQDFEDFILNLVGNDSNNRHFTQQFIQTHKNALTDYDNYFDKKSDMLTEKKGTIANFTATTLENDFFGSVFKFFRSKLPQDSVIIVPSLQKPVIIQQSLFIQHMYNSSFLYLANILRYIVEILYNSMPNDLALEIHQFFQNHQSKCAYSASIVLKTALGYAIGFRWFLKNIDKTVPIPVCHNNTLNNLSFYLEPKITFCLNHWENIDIEFLETYMQIVDTYFRELYRDIHLILSEKIVLLGPSEDIMEETFLQFSKAFGTKSFSKFPDYSEKYAPIIVIGQQRGGIPRDIYKKIPNDEEFLYMTTDYSGRVFIFIDTQNPDKITEAVKIIQNEKTVTDGFFRKL